MATGVDQRSDEISRSSFAPDRKLRAEIISQCEAWTDLLDVQTTLQKAVGIVEAAPSLHEDWHGQAASGCAVTIVLSDDDAVRQLNKTHRNIDKPTNVLSFPSVRGPAHPDDDGVTYLGDIVIAYETVNIEAEDQGRRVEDHLSHLAIHGLLHLLGYDHETDKDAHEMEQLEVLLLGNLGIANPYDETFQD